MIAWLALASLVLETMGSAPSPQWPQWGGPNRDFAIERRITAWDSSGPPRLWQRELGDGFSGIVAADGRAFTSYRDGAADVTVAIDLRTGQIQWQQRAEAPFRETCSERLGPAPRSTPLIAGPWLFTVSAGGLLQAVERATGALAWHRDLYEGRARDVRACGYSASPIAVDDTIIVPVGGIGRSLLALAMRDGVIRWQRHDFDIGYSSPLLITVDGQRQVVVLMAQSVIGIDPLSGALLWQHPHATFSDVNVMTPIWADGVLFVSSGYDGGSRALRLTRSGERTTVEELWNHKRFRIHFGNAIRLGRLVIGSNGDFGSAPATALDVDTGDVLWRSRAVSRASFLRVGSHLLILSEDGHLVLATADRTALRIEADATILNGVAWTVPTIADDVLLVRNREVLAAYLLPKGL